MFTQEIKHAVYSENEACCIFFFCHENSILEIYYQLDCLRKQINKYKIPLVRVYFFHEICGLLFHVKI